MCSEIFHRLDWKQDVWRGSCVADGGLQNKGGVSTKSMKMEVMRGDQSGISPLICGACYYNVNDYLMDTVWILSFSLVKATLVNHFVSYASLIRKSV